jgi:NAD(P)-dependent dehydrogenase (short-subunit alcohol dehydrogenase family)
MQRSLNVLITGTNKGIGNELVKLFVKRQPNAVIYATSREEPAVAGARWEQTFPNHKIQCKKLEIASLHSIEQFAADIKQTQQKFDIVINNAAICFG